MSPVLELVRVLGLHGGRENQEMAQRWSNDWIMLDRIGSAITGAFWRKCLLQSLGACLVVAFYSSVFMLSLAIFGHLWPSLAYLPLSYRLYDLCGSHYVNGSAPFSEPPSAIPRQIQRPVVLLLSSLCTAGHCLHLQIPIRLPNSPNCSVRHPHFNRIWKVLGEHYQSSSNHMCNPLHRDRYPDDAPVETMTLNWRWILDSIMMHLPC